MRKILSVQRGFTLIEMAVVIAVLAIISAVAMMNFGSTFETRDASAVQASQSALQQVISQGSTRADRSPSELMSQQSAAILRTTQDYLMQNSGVNAITLTAVGSSRYNVNISSSHRSAQLQVRPNGMVDVVSATGFNVYTVEGGKLEK